MPIGYVYAPISGNISQGPGCNSYHKTCPTTEGSSPVDVATTVNTTIYFYCNYPTVKSIYVTTGLQCCSASEASNYRQTVTIQLYGLQNLGCFIGTVRYGHMNLNMEISTGMTNLTKSNYRLGTTIGTSLCVPPATCCYTAIHVHMQRYGGTTLVTCNQSPINAGTTAIYKFEFPICST